MWWSKNPQRAIARLGFYGTRSAEQALSLYRLLGEVNTFFITLIINFILQLLRYFAMQLSSQILQLSKTAKCSEF
jgi:hypothetical protein